MVNRLKNKKIVLSLAALAVVSVIGGTILLSSSKSSEKSLDESNREQVNEVQEASILGVDEVTDSQEEEVTEVEATDLPAIEASEAINTTTNSNSTSSTTTQATPSCTPTLQAIIVRPYEFNYHLGDQADKISGSYGGTCITAEEVSYEWFIYGGTIPHTKFSTSSKPDFSAYQPGSYDLDLRVTARGLSSEVNTWVIVKGPPAPPVTNREPTIVGIFNPQEGQVFYRHGTSTGITTITIEAKGYVFDKEDGEITGNSLEWFIERQGGERTLIGNGNDINSVYTLPVCAEINFKLVLKVTDSGGLSRESVRNIVVAGGSCA